MKEEKNYPSPLQSWIIWSSGGFFFLLGFFHRVAPAVLHRELTVDFSLSASGLGALTSLYYYSYSAMQIPSVLALYLSQEIYCKNKIFNETNSG